MPTSLASRTLVLLAALTLLPRLTDAQERAGVGGRGSVPVITDPAAISVSQTVSLRIYPKTPEEATAYKNSLMRQQGVSEVKLSDDLRTVSVSYQGIYGDLPKLETKTSGVLLSPAKVDLTLTRNPSRAKCKTCGIEEHLRGVVGVASAAVKGSRAELYANLELLDLKKLAEAADGAGYQVEVQSHAWWSVKLEGDAAKIPGAFADVKGILKIERAGTELKLLALRALTPDALISAAQKAGLKATPTLVSP